MGFIPMGAQSRQEYFFIFFRLLEAPKKLMEIEFSSII